MTDSMEEEGYTSKCRHCDRKINPKSTGADKCKGSNPRYQFAALFGESDANVSCQNCGRGEDEHSGSWAYCPIPNNSYLYDQRGRPTGGWNTCCQCRTKRGYDEFEAKACDPCKARNSEWIWVKVQEEWKKVAPTTGELIDGSGLIVPQDEEIGPTAVDANQPQDDGTNASCLWSVFTCCFACSRGTRVAADDSENDVNTLMIEFPKHLRTLPTWVLNVRKPFVLDLDNCSLLEALPVNRLTAAPQLKELRCNGCPNLWSPPQEVCAQGGLATIKFLREVQRSGQSNNSMTLFLIGDGEAGKTSIVQSLKSRENTSQRIHEDQRTVGIDISNWSPTGANIDFELFDLAGQAVYSKTHQLFLQRRALYVLVWRADADNIIDTVVHWMNSLQIRMPGSYLLLVVTHIDAVEHPVLIQKCDEVRDAVTNRMKKMVVDSKGLIPLLKVCDDGQSVCVNCIAGEGIPELRNRLIAFAQSMPWYQESLPVSWITIKSKLMELSKSGVNFLSWNDYESLADKCGLKPGSESLTMATRFFHETCVVRHYGYVSSAKKERSKRPANTSPDILKETVFISINFVVNIMKGLIRHDHDTLLQHFIGSNQKTMVRRTNRLSVMGRLHVELVPFLWPCCKQSEPFWKSVRSNDGGECSLWPNDVVSDGKDLDRALALLEAFCLIVRKGREYLVPGLLSGSRTQISADAFSNLKCEFQAKYVYSALPEGAFDSVIVRIAQQCSKSEFSSSSAVFYNLGNILQVFTATGVDSYQHLYVRSTTKSLLELAKDSVESMEQFLGGLVKIDRAEQSTDDIREPVQVLFLADDNNAIKDLRKTVQEQLVETLGEPLVLDVQLSSSGPTYPEDARVVLICLTETIGQNTVSCLQLEQHIASKRAIIPIIMPGYNIADYSAWWPPNMQGLENHKLFVDMRKVSAEQAKAKISKELVPQIFKFLQEWKAVDPSLSERERDPDLEIPCENCIVAGFGVGDCHRFSRTDCLKLWDDFVNKKNQGDFVASDCVKCPKCHHSYLLPDLLATTQLNEVRACNICLAHGTCPPGYFKAGECRLLFDEGDRTRVGTVTCSRCQEEGRSGQTRIMDIAPAEVFVSYNWGKQLGVGKFSTQLIAGPLLRTIEQEADVMCWFDVEGGMGAGQDQIEEMRLGVVRANVVLILLSDAYVNSENCKREYIHACNNFKYIIPVLVPDTGLQCANGFSSGWTGTSQAGAPDFWKHANIICRDSRDPDNPSRAVDWSYLGLFRSILLPNKGPVSSVVVDDIVKRIVSRLHRGNHKSALV